MQSSLAAWFEEWAAGGRGMGDFDLHLTLAAILHEERWDTAVCTRLFGHAAPSVSFVRAAIQAEGSAAALAAKVEPIIEMRLNAPYGALTTALEAYGMYRLDIVFSPDAYTFVRVGGQATLWNSPERRKKGVYLWCIEHQGALLTNYVGKAWNSAGFNGRLSQEFKEYSRGQYCTPVDVDAFKRGIRRQLPCRMSREQLELEFREIVPLYRILLIPLNSGDESMDVENTIVHTLCQDAATSQFLCNKDKDSYRRRAELKFSADSPPIVGLTTPVPTSLRKAVSGDSPSGDSHSR